MVVATLEMTCLAPDNMAVADHIIMGQRVTLMALELAVERVEGITDDYGVELMQVVIVGSGEV